MNKNTRTQFKAYIAGVAADNNIDVEMLSAGQQFTVEPTVQQKLENAVLESSDFLKRINIVPVDELKGEALQLGVSGTIASRTDTDTKERETANISKLTGNTYECAQTNYDSHLKYPTLDAWAKFPDFAARIGKLKAERIALDRIMIGFNGESAEKTTDRSAHPLLQDVNKGWLKLIEERAPQRVMKEEQSGSGKIEIGADKTYKTLDALVYSLKEDMIPDQFRNDSQLVAIMGSDLLADKYFPLYNQAKPTEQAAGSIVASSKRVGGLQAVSAPFVPKGTVLITSLDNLSIYVQEGAMRRTITDAPRRDRVEDYLSSNEAYVVENYEAVALARNIKIVDAPAA